jgi:hypothetical protein
MECAAAMARSKESRLMYRRSLLSTLLLILVVGASRSAHAQEAVISPAATQPSTEHWVLRHQLRYLEARDHPRTDQRNLRQLTNNFNIAYGIRNDLSANVNVPLIYRQSRDGATNERDRDFGLGDVTAQIKWRIHQHDFGPIDTSRFSLIAGVQVPTFDRPFSTESVNPSVGGVYTHVQGRHGFNLSAIYKFNTGTGSATNLTGGDGKADALRYDGSYLYRLDPATYTSETKGAWYAVVELNGIYETNGDNELFISPGIMYEARTWTIEAAVQVPIWQELDHRAETKFVAIVGVRFLF